jgi:hypothetical protein
MCATEVDMKNRTTTILFILLLATSCKETSIGPTTGNNLLSNSTFQVNGVPSLQDWTVSDTSGAEFSTNVPSGSAGQSIGLKPMGLPASPLGAIYQAIPSPVGTHRYLISVFGKTTGIAGGVAISLNRPYSNLWKGWFPGISVSDTTWTLYSRADTLTAAVDDTIFVILSGGACEVCSIREATYFNTCKLEKLD